MAEQVVPRGEKILLVANWDWVLFNFRLPLARMLLNEGLDVTLVCPRGEYTDRLLEGGFRWLDWRMQRRSTSPLREVGAIWDLRRVYHDEQPDLVHHFTIKPVFYGTLAARMAGVPRVINTFTGLGYLFSDAGKAASLRRLVVPLLRAALRSRDLQTIFQNPQDRESLLKLGIVSEARSHVIAGTGVDLARFRPSTEAPAAGEPPAVLMASRLLSDKGVEEFIAAAKALRAQGVHAAFWLAGSPDPGNPASIPDGLLQAWAADSPVELLGHRSDMPNLLRQAAVAVLPSYHEGVPLFLLEAAASGLPIVATDIEGCRAVVDHGVNGFLVPVRGSAALAERLRPLLVDEDLRRRMGQASRLIAEQRFDARSILAKYLELYHAMGVGLGLEAART